MKTLAESLLWLMQREHMGIKLGLNNIKRLLTALNHPERNYTVVQIAGTNGKGSTAAALAEMLKQAGLRVGLFTSPHIVSPRERFLFNGKYIDETILIEAIAKVKETVENANINATFFECSTATAALAFAYAKADVAVFEVGMGGRLDATTALENRKLAVLTRIGIDHTKHLGNTIASIATEKAGIFTEGMHAVCAPQPSEALTVFKRIAKKRSVNLIEPKIFTENGKTCAQVLNKTVCLSDIALQGEHQRTNVATAAAAVVVGNRLNLWSVSNQAIINGAAKFFWPLRLQIIDYKPKILLDVAHNLDGTRALAEFLRTNNSLYQKRVAVVALLADKQIGAILRKLSEVVDEFVFTQAFSHRAAHPTKLLEVLHKEGINTPATVVPLPVEALSFAKAKAGVNGLVIATGSFYMLSALVEWLQKSGVPILDKWQENK